MKNLNELGVQELNVVELRNNEGGNPVLIFLAGAVVGGIFYDVVKSAYVAGVEAYIDAAKDGTFVGVPHGR